LKKAVISLSENPKTAQKGLREALKKLQAARLIKSLGGAAWILVQREAQ
jgi:DNA-binding FadR family transcriptional regulator